MHTVLKGVSRDQMMARHQSNHIQVVYAPDLAAARHGLFTKAAAMQEVERLNAASHEVLALLDDMGRCLAPAE